MLAALFALVVATPAQAQDEGIPVTVEVLNSRSGEVVPTAVVRHPDEAERHRVNTETGRWTEKVLYMKDGSELLFEKDLILRFEVSAPGFVNETVTYQVRKRKNVIQVYLQEMKFDGEEDADAPTLDFIRDRPLDK
ncbi:MAG: hypothetical protein H6737_05840 [Alphaproteobacteria bacterium]|nr:hypothetical protein [Alphaproteobacteria bacterium]